MGNADSKPIGRMGIALLHLSYGLVVIVGFDGEPYGAGFT